MPLQQVDEITEDMTVNRKISYPVILCHYIM